VSCGQQMRDDNLGYTWLLFELPEPRDASRGPRYVPVGPSPIIGHATNFCTVESSALARAPRGSWP